MILRRTLSLCPLCLRRVDAVYVQEDGIVMLHKSCPDHGPFDVPIWREAEDHIALPTFASWSRPKSPSFPAHPATTVHEGCPWDCGLCPEHGQHTCTGLVEVTQRCNMACPLCYADAGGENTQADPDLADIAARLDTLRHASGPCNVQISGGEPTLREDLPDIVSMARQRGFGLVQLNTNGLRLANDAGYAAALARAGLDSVYLQWDGVHESSCLPLRGRFCLQEKQRAVEHCAHAGLGVVLVATVVHGVNDGDLGDLLRYALRLGSAVRGLHIQPAAFFGRAPWPLAEAPRLTLSDVMAALSRQAPELIKPTDFHPPGCEHELCSFSAVYRRTEEAGQPGLALLDQAPPCCGTPATVPTAAAGADTTRQFTALHWKGVRPAPAMMEPMNSAADSFARFLANAGAAKRFTLSCMAFQDALSLDVARVRACCIHVVRSDGRLIPFCLHNLTAANGTPVYKKMSP